MNWEIEDAEAGLFLPNTKRAAEQRNGILECTVPRSDYGSSCTDVINLLFSIWVYFVVSWRSPEVSQCSFSMSWFRQTSQWCVVLCV